MADREGKFEEVKGKAKQAAGDLTDRDDLKREGQVDETAGKGRQKADELGDRAGDAVDSAADKVKDLLNKDKGDER